MQAVCRERIPFVKDVQSKMSNLRIPKISDDLFWSKVLQDATGCHGLIVKRVFSPFLPDMRAFSDSMWSSFHDWNTHYQSVG